MHVTEGSGRARPVSETRIYRVCAGPASTWAVFAEEQPREPVASFRDKSSAVRYAMDLARRRTSWHGLLKEPGAGEPTRAHA